MKKILQVLLKNKRAKDYKLLLCRITVVVTSLTLFTALNALPLLEESLKQDLRQTTVGEANYIVTHSANELFNKFAVDKGKKLDVLSLNASIAGQKNTKINVWGTEYSTFLEVFGNTYTERGEVSFPTALKDNEVLVSPKIGERLNISDGSKIDIELFGQKLSATAVIAPKDNYFVKANENLVVCNPGILYDTLKISPESITLCFLYDIQKDSNTIKKLEENKDTFYIKDAIDPEYVSSNMATYYGIDFMIFIFILLIAIDILKSTGLIYVTERSKFIGTLRSNGAEKKNIVSLFSRIGLNISLTGCILGMCIGLALVILFAKFGIGIPNPFVVIDIVFLIVSIIITLGVTVLISRISFVKPVKQLLKKSDRSLILEDVSKSMQQESNSKYALIYPTLLVLLFILGFWISNWGVAVVLLYSVALVFVLLKSVKVIFTAFKNRIKEKTGKGLLLISSKNVGTNIYLRKTLKLTATISLFITIVGVLIFSVLSAMTSFYKDYRSDAFVRLDDGTFKKEELAAISSAPGVTDTFTYYSGKVTIINSDEKRQVSVIGIDDPETYDKNFFNLKLTWLDGFEPAMFNKSENVIMSKIICNRFGFKLGDKVKLNDGKIDKNFTIVAMTPSLQELGDMVYISRHDSDFCEGSILNGIYIKCKDTESLEKSVEDIFYNRNYRYKDVSQMKENDITNGMQIIIFFLSFAALVGMASITGIYSNYKLSYIMRKKEFAIFYSNGYSRQHILRMLISEIAIISTLGYLAGILILWIVKKPLENLMELVELPIKLSMKAEVFLAMLLVVIAMMLINIVLACKTSRISRDKIIEELKK